MDGWLRQSTAVTVPVGPFVDSTDGDAEEAALTIAQADVRLSKNGAASAQKNNATSASHDADGVYLCPFSTTDTNTLGQLVAWVHVAGALFAKHIYHVIPANVWDSLFGSDLLQVDSREFAGVTAVSGAIPAVAAGANGGLPLGNAAGAVTLANATHTGAVIPTVTTLTNAPSDSSGVTTLLARLPAGLFTGLTNFAHWLGAIAGKQAANGTAQTEIRASGAGSGTFDPTTDSLEALRDNTGTAGAGLTVLSTAANLAALAGKFTGITLLAEWLGLIAGKQVGNTTARTELRATGAGSGTYDELTDSLEALKDDQMTAVELENAVWDATAADHNDVGSTGEALLDAGGAGTPPTVEEIRAEMDANSTALAAILEDTGTTIPATLATIDARLDTEIPAIISTLATIAGYLDTEVAAILADTNELQTDWANGGRLDLLIDSIITLTTAVKAVTDVIPDAGAMSSIAQAATFSTTTRNDPTALAGALAAGLTPLAKLDWVFAQVMRSGTFNKTTGEHILKNQAGTDIAKSTAADDGTTTTRGAYGAP